MILGLLQPADLPEPMALRREPEPAPRGSWWAWLGRWLLALLLLGALVGGGAWGLHWLLAPATLPLERVRFEGEVQHLSRDQLKHTLAGQLAENFLLLDLAQVRAVLEQVPWVARASVRRVWPGALEVWVEERQPLARWGARSLVTPHGEVFTPDPVSVPQGLPILDGPLEAAPAVCERFAWLRDRLRGSSLEIQGLRLSARYAWSLELGGGLVLQLGTREFEARLERFLRHRERLGQPGEPRTVDLRYSNGFTVRYQQQPADLSPRTASKGGRGV